jgi:altronate hydrolase
MKPALAITGRDNVATALVHLDSGQTLSLGDHTVVVGQPIPAGHKVALTDIPTGGSVIKYGAPIGTATVPIPAGAHVHTHNVASGRGRGDLAGRADREGSDG